MVQTCDADFMMYVEFMLFFLVICTVIFSWTRWKVNCFSLNKKLLLCLSHHQLVFRSLMLSGIPFTRK